MTTMKTRQELEARSIAEQAAEWLLILEDDRPEDREAFADWLRQSPQHVGALLRASAVDALLDEVDPNREIELQEGPLAEDQLDVIRIGPSTRVRSTGSPTGHRAGSWLNSRSSLAIAAGVALLAIGAAVLGGRQFSGDQWKHYATTVGEQRAIALEDGSVMFLGPGSKVDTQFVANERQLKLTAGEAIFRVRHDTSRPFRVHSGKAVIQAVGTQFNVSLMRGESVVSVIEGVVQVSHEASAIEKFVSPIGFVRST